MGWVLSSCVPQLFVLPVAVVAAFALRRRAWGAAGIAGVVALAQVFGPMGLCLGRPAEGAADLRVLSYNVGQFKETPTCSQEGIAAAIRRLDPDVACLQEASQNGQLGRPTRLEALLPEYRFYSVSGMTIASKRPILRAETRIFESHLMPSHWNVQEVWLDGLRVVNVHMVPEGWEPPQWPGLSWAGRVERKRRLRAEEIDEVLARAGEGPVVVCGDFNLQPFGPLYRRLAGRLTDAYRATATGFGATLTSATPVKRVDYVWTHGLKPLRTRVVPLTTSDHRPVVAELSLGP